MAIKDFFWFKKEDYEERIKDRSKYSDERIHRERSHNARQQFSGCWSIGNGLLGCIVTGGLTSGIVLYDFRNRSVSKRKLELLEKEAERRGMKKYDQGKRDYWISCLSNAVHCFIGCKVDSCLAGMLAEAPVPTYIKDIVQTTDDRSEAVAQEKEQPNSTKTNDIPSKELAKEEVQVKKQGQPGQARITQAVESQVSEPHALEKQVPIVRNASVPSVQDVAGVQVKQPNTPVQRQGRISNVSEGRVSEPHSLEAGRRGMKKRQKRKRDSWISCLSNSVGFCIGSDSCLMDMLPEALVPNVQDVAQMTDVKPTRAGAEAEAEAETPNTERQDGITLREENQVSQLHALQEAGRLGKKKRGNRKRDLWISCTSNSLGFCIGSDSCLTDMLAGEPVPSVEDVNQMTNVKSSEDGAEARNPVTAQVTDNPSGAVRPEAEKLNTRVEGQDAITVCEENQISELDALEEAGRRNMEKHEKSKRLLWISRIYDSGGFCIGSDNCLADMLPGEPVPSGEDVVRVTDVKPSEARAQAGKPIMVHMTDNPSKAAAQAEKLKSRVEGHDSSNLRAENKVSETRPLGKGAGRRTMKTREKRKRDFWISCISISVGFCVGPDSCLKDLLPEALVSNVEDAGEDVIQKTDVNPSQAEAQARKPITVKITDNLLEADMQARKPIIVQMTDNLLKTGAQLEMPNTRVEGQDRITQGLEHGLEDHVSEPYAAGFPVSDIQRASPVPGSVLSCEGVEAAEYRVAVASALEAETNGAEFASNNQKASSALEF